MLTLKSWFSKAVKLVKAHPYIAVAVLLGAGALLLLK
jgi:hypothetical protein